MQGEKVITWRKQSSKLKSTEKSTGRIKRLYIFSYYNEVYTQVFTRAVFSTQVWRFKGTVPSTNSTKVRTSWWEHIQDTDPKHQKVRASFKRARLVLL